MKAEPYSLAAIPRPGRAQSFSGVMHIHGVLDAKPKRTSDLIVSDQDFGEFYLRRRVVPDFIYDAARLFNLVLIGYSANDPPMRYLLNAVAADGTRFEDLKERFTFVGVSQDDPVTTEDWKGRGITPVLYSDADGHLALLKALERWADLSAINGKRQVVDRELKRIVKSRRANAAEEDRDLFDHLFRRAIHSERLRLTRIVSKAGAHIGWFDSIANIAAEFPREAQR